MNIYTMQYSLNYEKEYPSNLGQKWSDKEELLLLRELKQNMNIDIIAKNHNRTTGGINSRIREIAYKLYTKNTSMKDIITQTKLSEKEIIKIIKKKQNYVTEKLETFTNQIAPTVAPFNIENEIIEMKSQLSEIIEMMKAIYEFENIS